jgi:hypothetical protein
MNLGAGNLRIALRDFVWRTMRFSFLVAMSVAWTAYLNGGMTPFLRWLAIIMEIGAVVTAATLTGARFLKSDDHGSSSHA